MKSVICFTLLLSMVLELNAQRITRNYVNVSMSQALRELNGLNTGYTINFLFNELEDFSVTTHVKGKTAPEAVQQLIGFYPIKMTVTDRNEIYVECIQKTEHHLKGRIVDEHGKPLAYANVTVLNPVDSAYITGGVSNESGVFVVPVEQTRVLARISYVGYITIYRQCRVHDLGTIAMQPDAYQLNGVTVKGERILVKAENGQLVYDMAQLIEILPADDAYEALTRIPGVNDTGNELTFNGRSVTLIINGKVTTLDASQVKERLKAMPAKMLARAEVMTAAPAKYHVRGMAINVVTKDYVGSHQVAGQLQGTWYQSRYAEGQGKGSLLMQQGKLGLDATYSVIGGKAYGKAEHKANHPLGDTRIPYHDVTCQTNRTLSHDYHLGMDYTMAENHQLSVEYTGEWTSSEANNITIGTANSTQQFKDNTYLHNVDVNYQAPFGLQLGACYTNYQNPLTQQLDGMMHETRRDLTVDSRQRISKWMITADQEHELNNGWGLNYGLKLQLTNNNSFQTTLDPNGQVIDDATSRVNYNERIINGYIGASKQVGQNLSLDASLSAEQYHATLWNEWRIYPTLNAMWNINPDNMLNLSFTSDAIYPSYWSTMSSIHYTSPYTEIWGNPSLKPMSKYDLNLMWQYKRKYMFTAFATFEPDYFVQLPYQPSDRMAVVMIETNMNYSNYYGLQSSVQFSAGDWLNGNMRMTGLYRHDKSQHFFDLPFDRRHFTVILGGNVSARLLRRHNLTLMLNPFFQTSAIQGVYDIRPMFMFNGSLRWTSADDKWSVVANATNIFNTHASTQSRQGNQDYTMNVWMRYAELSLSVIYRIGSFKEKKNRPVDTSRMGH